MHAVAQDEVEDTFPIVMFGFQFATYVCQLILSLIPEPKAKGTRTHQQEVRVVKEFFFCLHAMLVECGNWQPFMQLQNRSDPSCFETQPVDCWDHIFFGPCFGLCAPFCNYMVSIIGVACRDV